MSELSDPGRLTDDPNAGKLGEWLRAGEQELPSDAQLSRLAARLEPTFASPGGGSASPLAGPLPKLLLGAFAVAGAALLANTLRAPRETERETAPTVSAARSAAQPVKLPSAEPVLVAPLPADSAAEMAPSPSASVGGAARAAGASEAARKPVLSEAALLEQARSALARDPARALSLTQQHQARFPSGALKQEREVIAIEALRRLGRGSAASERASSFERAYPDSAHRRAVEAGRPK